jgi:hypothetical protein
MAEAGQGGEAGTACTAPRLEVTVFQCDASPCELRDTSTVLEQDPVRQVYDELNLLLSIWVDESCQLPCRVTSGMAGAGGVTGIGGSQGGDAGTAGTAVAGTAGLEGLAGAAGGAGAGGGSGAGGASGESGCISRCVSDSGTQVSYEGSRTSTAGDSTVDAIVELYVIVPAAGAQPWSRLELTLTDSVTTTTTAEDTRYGLGAAPSGQERSG